jgi:hypothetical protein
MGAEKVAATAFILGLALYITYILSSWIFSVIVPFLTPIMAFFGPLAPWILIALQILLMGLVAGFILKYVKAVRLNRPFVTPQWHFIHVMKACSLPMY